MWSSTILHIIDVMCFLDDYCKCFRYLFIILLNMIWHTWSSVLLHITDAMCFQFELNFIFFLSTYKILCWKTSWQNPKCFFFIGAVTNSYTYQNKLKPMNNKWNPWTNQLIRKIKILILRIAKILANFNASKIYIHF
jgi:hypothetical protein